MDLDVRGILVPACVTVICAAVLFVLRNITFRFLHRWAEKAEIKTGDIIISAFKVPSVYWCIAIGLYSGIAISEIPDKYAFYFSKVIHIIVIFSVTVATANLSGNVLKNYIQKANFPVPPTGLVYGILKGTILAIGLLIVLGVLGISVTPLITALGVGGLAVALALKDTLENLFAGIHILMEKSMRVGDLIKIETGQEGYIEDITWRTTRVKMLPNNMVIIPNSKLSQSIVTNYYLPDRTTALAIAVSVSYDSDIEKVEKALIEETKKAVGEVAGLLAAPEPSAVLVPGFKESSLEFTLTCQVREYSDQGPVQHELRKRILRRFRAEAIEMPFPARTVYLKQDA